MTSLKYLTRYFRFITTVSQIPESHVDLGMKQECTSSVMDLHFWEGEYSRLETSAGIARQIAIFFDQCFRAELPDWYMNQGGILDKNRMNQLVGWQPSFSLEDEIPVAMQRQRGGNEEGQVKKR